MSKQDSHTLRKFAFAYLIWHCAISFILLGTFILSALTRFGVIHTNTPMPAPLKIAGVLIPTFVGVLIPGILVALIVITGFILAFFTLHSAYANTYRRANLYLARFVFIVCVCGFIWSFMQHDALYFLSCLICVALTGCLAHELSLHLGHRSKKIKSQLTLVQADSYTNNSCYAFALCMGVWGIMKLLMCITLILSGIEALPIFSDSLIANATNWYLSPFGTGILLFVMGLFLCVCGLYGCICLRNHRHLVVFARLCFIGLCITSLIFLVIVMLMVLGTQIALSQVLFYTVDIVLCAVNLYYARMFEAKAQPFVEEKSH